MESSPGTSPESGDRRRLDRPPSDRFRTAPGDPGTNPDAAAPAAMRQLVLRGLAVGIAGAIVMTLLGGPLSVTGGLVGAAGAIGWVVGMVTRPMRPAAVLIALASVVLGLIGVWLYAGIEGGVLGPVEYLAEVQGILVPIELAAAGLLAAAAS